VHYLGLAKTVCLMDEFQFIESLDALLANEAIDETTTAAVELANASTSPVDGQGMLSGSIGSGQIAESSAGNWLVGGGNYSNVNTSDPFTMHLHSNTGLTAVSTTQSVGAAPFPQFTRACIEQPGTIASSAQDALGPALPTASSTGPMSSPSQTLKITTVTNASAGALSGVASVCSTNSRGSSNASSSRRRGSGICNKSTMSVGSAGSRGLKTTKSSSHKRTRGGTSTAVSDSEDDCSRRRYDRNLREQRRSQKITHQIDELREVLAAGSVRFKPDKYSTLVSVVEYVKQLQKRSTMLDMEQKKLLNTITRTNEIVNEPYLRNHGTSTSSTTGVGRNSNGGIGTGAKKPDSALSGVLRSGDDANGVVVGSGGDIYNDDELVFVRNVDYKCIFDKCGMPLAVASIDGRLMDCNHEFVKLTGYRREELLPNEQYQKRRRCLQRHQQRSTVIENDVTSSFLSDPIFPDKQISTCSNNDDCNDMMNTESDAHNESDTTNTISTSNNEERNFSLFNLLNRNNMEEVFMSLSEMLKQPPTEENGRVSISKTDYWSGNVRLSRNTHMEMQINVSLVRSPQGRAKFFDCSLTPLTPLPV